MSHDNEQDVVLKINTDTGTAVYSVVNNNLSEDIDIKAVDISQDATMPEQQQWIHRVYTLYRQGHTVDDLVQEPWINASRRTIYARLKRYCQIQKLDWENTKFEHICSRRNQSFTKT